jgi:AcrR family transcriptional regulator
VAMVGLCFEHGYRQTTLDMLLDRAEVDRAAFERHFTDLEDCFCEVYQEMQKELMERVLAAIACESTWRDRLRATAYTMADFVAEDEKRTRFVIFEVRSAGDRAIYLLSQSYERLFDLIDQGRRERRLPGSISRATAEAIGGTMFFQMYASYAAGSIESVRAKVPEMMYVAVLPYLGAEAAAEELRLVPGDEGVEAPPPPGTTLSSEY